MFQRIEISMSKTCMHAHIYYSSTYSCHIKAVCAYQLIKKIWGWRDGWAVNSLLLFQRTQLVSNIPKCLGFQLQGL